MIRRINKGFKLKKEHRDFISELGKLEGHEWESPSLNKILPDADKTRYNNSIKAIKAHIKRRLQITHSQSIYGIDVPHCAYCGNILYLTSIPQIEHVAPKANNRFPHFMFTINNLVLSCSLCNQYGKGNNAIITKEETSYSKCSFEIVHPVFDDPDRHYVYRDRKKTILDVKLCSEKGKKSIEYFKLSSYVKNIQRIEDLKRRSKPISKRYAKLIQMAKIEFLNSNN